MYKVVANAKQNLVQWNAAQNRLTSAPITPTLIGDGAHVWVRPKPGIIKVSVDAAIFAEEEVFGFGLVARDSDGTLVQAVSKRHTGVISPEKAEALAIKEALSWIDRMNWHQVVVESDCLVIVQAIRSEADMRSSLGAVVKDCRRLISNSNKVSLYFIKR